VPIDCDISGSVVLTRAYGDVSFEEIQAHIERLIVHSGLPAPYLELYDTRTVTGYDLSTRDLRQLAARATELGARVRWGRVAIVAARDLIFGIGRMFEAFTEHSLIEFRVFRELEEAEEWLSWVETQRPPRGANGDTAPAAE